MIYSVLVTLAIMLCWAETAAAEDGLLFRIPDDDPNQNSDVVNFVAFSVDGRAVAAAYGRFIGLLQNSRPGQAILWDEKNGTRQFTLGGYVDGVSSVAFSRTVSASPLLGTLATSSFGSRRTGNWFAKSLRRASFRRSHSRPIHACWLRACGGATKGAMRGKHESGT